MVLHARRDGRAVRRRRLLAADRPRRGLHRTCTARSATSASSGRSAAVALNPATPAIGVAHVLDLVDLVLVMTVNPGFGGQAYIATMEPKIAEVRRMIDDAGLRRHGRRRGRRRHRTGDGRRRRRRPGPTCSSPAVRCSRTRSASNTPSPTSAPAPKRRRPSTTGRRRHTPSVPSDTRDAAPRSAVRPADGARRAARAPSRAAKGGDPLAPVTVVVPTNTCGVMARRAARPAPGGIVGVDMVTLNRLAELIAGPALAASGRSPMSSSVVDLAVAQVLEAQPGVVPRRRRSSHHHRRPPPRSRRAPPRRACCRRLGSPRPPGEHRMRFGSAEPSPAASRPRGTTRPTCFAEATVS